jgi:small subunit ribosomal protein S4
MIDNSCKKCRREGEKLFLKGDRCFSPKCAMNRKAYSPGQQGASGGSRRRFQSEYGTQLREKQKVKRIYDVREKQFRNYYEKASRKEGVTGEELLKMLEMRLDNTVYRASFADSRSKARQMVSHGHITVNGKKVNIASYGVKVGDKIGFFDKFKKSKDYKTIEEKLTSKPEIAQWLTLDAKKLEATVAKNPERDNIEAQINENLIVEFYSR